MDDGQTIGRMEAATDYDPLRRAYNLESQRMISLRNKKNISITVELECPEH